jgi:hypothetical protein
MFHSPLSGFSLAEILIALLILAEIATFTIPKILTAKPTHNTMPLPKKIYRLLRQLFSNFNWLVESLPAPRLVT